MKFLRNILDKNGKHFHKGGKLEKYYPLYEALDTILYSPGTPTRAASHVRDGMDLKRIMITVVVAMVPAIGMAMYNTGLQAHLAIQGGAKPLDSWQTGLFSALGGQFDPANVAFCLLHGALYFLPSLLVTFLVGGNIEVISAILRKHDINEGFLVTGVLLPLTLPPNMPLWQVALGIAFGVIFGKEVFGGTGMNFLNPALTARAFLFFAYPGQISGDKVWVAADFAGTSTDAVTGATWLARAAIDGNAALAEANWWDAFLGFVPGSMGETSAAACFLGALLLIITRVGSWRIMLGVTLGTFAMTTLLNGVSSGTNPFMAVPFHWHIVLGGWALGTVFMATDPVSASFTHAGRWVYGFFIGVLVILVRVINPAYPEGMMLAILFMNLFAPLIDHFVVRGNINRRIARNAAA